MRRIAFFLLVIALPASAQMDATMKRGDTKTFTVPFSYTTQSFTTNTTFFVSINAYNGLTLGHTTIPGFTCTETPSLNQCQGTMPGTAGSTNLNITQILSVASDASMSTGTWVIQIVGEGLSGLQPKVGTITITDAGPKVIVTKMPEAAISIDGALVSASFTIKNIGNGPTTVTMVIPSSGPFGFMLPGTPAPTSSTTQSLAPGDEYSANLLSTITNNGYYAAAVALTGQGVDPNASLILRLLVTPSQSNTPTVQPEKNLVDVSGTGSTVVVISFTNNSTGPSKGLMFSDSPIVSFTDAQSQLSLQAGETKAVAFSVDNSKIASAGLTSATASVTYRFAAASSAKTRSSTIAPMGNPPGTGSVSVTLVSTVNPTASAATIPPLTSIHDELFLAGVGHAQGSVGLFISDLTLFPQVMRGNAGFRFLSVPNIDVYYTPLNGGTTSKFTLVSVAPPNVAAMGDFVSTVYGANAQIGSLQIRTPGYAAGEGALGVNANVFNVSGKTGTYGTAVPIFKFGAFECTQDANKKLYLTGLRKDASGHTNFYIQETCGTAAKVNLDFYDASGNKVGSTTADVPAFSATQLGASTLPNGAVSAVVSHVAGTGGGFVAYATPVDELSGDTWAQVDWPNQRGYQGSVPVIIPVAGATPGANNTYFRTDVAIMNTGSTSGSGTLRFYNRTGEIIDKTISVDALHTNLYSDITTNLFGISTPHVGYLVFTPSSGSFVITSRNYSTPVGSNATFGTAVPTLSLSGAAMGQTQVRRIGGVEDASPDTVAAGRGATFRSNFGLIETSGQPATVKVTVYYNYTSSLTSTVLGSSSTFNLTANQFLLQGFSTLFANRAAVGDLHNATIEFEVIGGTGKVIPFISTVDNGSGDSTFRSE
jgi:hypothetical protein